MARTPETVIIGAGQAGLATSYWLTQAGVEHQILERRDTLGGAYQDRWDGFYMNTPNFTLDLPGMPYTGDDPEAFMPRTAIVNLLRRYAEVISAPVHTGVDVTRLSSSKDGTFSSKPPSAACEPRIHDYRNPKHRTVRWADRRGAPRRRPRRSPRRLHLPRSATPMPRPGARLLDA